MLWDMNISKSLDRYLQRGRVQEAVVKMQQEEEKLRMLQ
jgi:hypothetical protein